MPSEGVDALRRLYDEWAKGNLPALGEVADPAIEWEWAPEMASLFGGPHTYRGLDEIWTATKEWLTAWEHYWMTADERRRWRRPESTASRSARPYRPRRALPTLFLRGSAVLIDMRKARRLWLGDWQHDESEHAAPPPAAAHDDSDTVRLIPVSDRDAEWRAERRRKVARGIALGVAIALLFGLGYVLSSGGGNDRLTAETQQTPPAAQQAPQFQAPQQTPQVPQGVPPQQGFGGPDLTGPEATKAAAAAVAKFPGDVERVTAGPGGGYIVHVIQGDGNEVHVLVNDQFKVDGSDAGAGPRNFGNGTSQ
jgi:hypothetical protein